MLFHCMTSHGFATANVIRTGDLVDVDVKCQGASSCFAGGRFLVRFQAPKSNRVEGHAPEKHFALLGLSCFNFTKNPAPCTSTQVSYADLVLDESLILSESV